MDRQQLQVFRAAFKRANYGRIDMPKHIDATKIYDIEFYTDGMRGGYKVRFRVYKNEQQEYVLDLLGGDDHSTWHKRINKHGNISDLENYKAQSGIPVYPDDPERTERERAAIAAYNRQLHETLVKSGLERNFEDDAFEQAHVIYLRNYGF